MWNVKRQLCWISFRLQYNTSQQHAPLCRGQFVYKRCGTGDMTDEDSVSPDRSPYWRSSVQCAWCPGDTRKCWKPCCTTRSFLQREHVFRYLNIYSYNKQLILMMRYLTDELSPDAECFKKPNSYRWCYRHPIFSCWCLRMTPNSLVGSAIMFVIMSPAWHESITNLPPNVVQKHVCQARINTSCWL